MFWVIVLGLAGVVIIIVGVAVGLSMLEQLRSILSTPHHTAGNMPAGMASVSGKTAALLDTNAPFSGQQVVYCEAKADQMEITDDHKVRTDSFTEVYKSRTPYPFFIEDGSGRILVYPKEAFVDINRTFDHENFKQGVGHVKVTLPDKPICDSLDAANVLYGTPDAPYPMRFSEQSLAVDEDVFAIGLCSNKPEDIRKALADLELAPGTRLDRILMTGPGKKEKLYITTGNRESAINSLSRYGRMFIGFGSAIGALLCIIALVVWLS